MWRDMLCTALAVLAAAGSALAEECGTSAVGYRVMHLGDKIVAVWYPTTATPARYSYGPNFSSRVAVDALASTACGEPVLLVVFSHGDLGCGLQSIAFTEELALGRTENGPDLRCSVSDLGSIYLGGFTWNRLSQALRVEELTPGAAGRADAIFRTACAPWCPEIF